MRLPGLHSIHWKVFVFHMVVLILPLAYFATLVKKRIEISYLHSTEEGMIDTAVVISELYARMVGDLALRPDQLRDTFADVFQDLEETYPLKARLFGFTKAEVDTRLIFYDNRGRVVYDTLRQIPVGSNFSGQSDVRYALARQYGARWEIDPMRKRVNLYSTVPVVLENKLVGAVSVVKPTNRVRNFIARSWDSFLLPGFLVLLLATLLAYLLSAYITRNIWLLAAKAEKVAAGDSTVRLETWTRSELGMLARAVERMRQKLEGKAYVEEMVTNMSHELKTPLAAIKGAAELLQEGAADDPVAREKFLGNISHEVQRLDDIVTNLLKLSKVETEPFQNVDAEEVISILRGLLPVYQRRAEILGVILSADIGQETAFVKITRDQFVQVIGNLLDNALQFTPAGKEISIVCAKKENFLEIIVRDKGVGIENDLISKIFDRFFTTPGVRSETRGTGLGLSIVKSILNTIGGSVSVISKAGEGSEFKVLLPLNE